MNVFVDDVIQIKDLDIFKEAGFKSALAKTFMVKSTSEFLNVSNIFPFSDLSKNTKNLPCFSVDR